MLLTAQDLLRREPMPSREAIREHLSGNYCRCTGYHAIVDAVVATAARASRRSTMRDLSDTQPGLSVLDRPNSYIGRSVPRPNLARLPQGRGQYVSDMVLPRMAHVVFVRSPHAHARIVGIDAAEAKRAPGVVAVVTGAELAEVCTPWVGVLSHLKGLKSAPQHAIAVDRACWQGEAVAAVVAQTRAAAEDAAELVSGAVRGARTRRRHGDGARCGNARHPSRARRQSRLRAPARHRRGRPAFAEADAVVEATFRFGRHTGVTLEPRSIVADWNAGRGSA